jgi:hypothetical protein
MLVSVHLADLGRGTTLRSLRSAPKPETVPGLRWARTALGAPLGGSAIPNPSLTRLGLVAFWDDDAALDAFLASSSLAETMAGGFSMRLAPLRSYGSWPGLDPDLPHARNVQHDGPLAVLTLGRARVSQLVRFFRTSNKAERAVVTAPGLLWATGLGAPPFFATCSLWESTAAIAAYAFGAREKPHPGAIAADHAKPFHHEEAFVRFRPYAIAGALHGKNAVDAAAITTVPAPASES